MIETDPYILTLLQFALVFFSIYTYKQDLNIRNLNKTAECTGEVERGEKSMTSIYTVYGAAMASFLLLVNNATGVEGNKVVIIILDFLCITYLFFFSTWFRNKIFFPLAQHIRKD